jgi:diguanylate cyclase (GGDEF)-like protein
MDELIKAFFEGSGIAIFVYFIIRGMRKEISALNKTVKQQNEIFEAMNKRIAETERMAESYKKWWEELQESYDKHKAALTKAKDEHISELEKAIEQKDVKLQAKAQAELDMITMQENIIEDLKRQAVETEQQLIEMKTRARKLSEIDPLTGVNNRISIERHIIKLINQNVPFSVLFMDFDHFKSINDVYGHGVGDQLLIEQANRIGRLSDERVFGRVGGDEFIIVDRSNSMSETEVFTVNLLKEMAKPLMIGDTEYMMTSSVGISRFPDHDIGARRLMAKADAALYAAKNDGRNCYKLWDSEATWVERSETHQTIELM